MSLVDLPLLLLNSLTPLFYPKEQKTLDSSHRNKKPIKEQAC